MTPWRRHSRVTKFRSAAVVQKRVAVAPYRIVSCYRIGLSYRSVVSFYRILLSFYPSILLSFYLSIISFYRPIILSYRSILLSHRFIVRSGHSAMRVGRFPVRRMKRRRFQIIRSAFESLKTDLRHVCRQHPAKSTKRSWRADWSRACHLARHTLPCSLFPGPRPTATRLCSNQIRHQPCHLPCIPPAGCSRWTVGCVRWRPATAIPGSTSERTTGARTPRTCTPICRYCCSPTRFYPASEYQDLNFFLQHYGVFLQVPGVFSIFRPRACTYRSEPDSCRLAYGTAPFGPIACKQLLMDVPCVSVHSRRTTSHMAGAYTLSRATPSESLWTLQIKRSRVVFSNPMYFAIFLQCAVTENLNQVYNL